MPPKYTIYLSVIEILVLKVFKVRLRMEGFVLNTEGETSAHFCSLA